MSKIKYIYFNKEIFIGEPIKEKNLIIQYFEKFKPNFATSAFITDCVSKQKIEGHYNMGYEYNGYFWTEEDIYHFKKYNMPLNPNFIKFVITQLV